MASYWNLIVIIVIFNENSIAQDVDGGWSPWSRYPMPCTLSCGGGTQTFTRGCGNPVAQGKGKPCPGNDTDVRSCNTEACKTSWSGWSDCNVHCDIGVSQRHTVCGESNCSGSQLDIESKECIDWNKTCKSPCTKNLCPDYAKCIDLSTDTRPNYNCTCVMGYQMNRDGKCARPSPSPPLPRQIPTMDTVEKSIAIVITRTASTILLVMVGITLVLFATLRIFTVDRLIQMNMELALEISHLLLLFPNTMAEDNKETCRLISIGLHYTFTVCFMFILLESIHMYSMIAFVVQKNGLLSVYQNFLAGWGVPIIVMLFTVCFHIDDYGAEYHCWLRMDTSLIYGQYIPIVIMLVLTFTMTEAAGNADLKPLENMDYKQLFSAKISQRSNIIFMCLLFASWVLGTLSDHEQNLALYSSFSILNAVIGFFVFFSHSLGNQEVRRKLRNVYDNVITHFSRKQM